jgi:hypothetical protein
MHNRILTLTGGFFMSERETFTISLSGKTYSLASVREKAQTKGQNLSELIVEAIDSVMLRNTTIDKIAADVRIKTRLDEWRFIESLALCQAARAKAELDVRGAYRLIPDFFNAENPFQSLYDYFKNKEEREYLQELLQAEAANAPLNPAQVAFLKSNHAGRDYEEEVFLSETIAKKRLLDLVKSGVLTTADCDMVNLRLFSRILKDAGEVDNDMALEIVKNLLLNVK